MKSITTLLVALALGGSASATTIALGGGTAAATLITSTGVTLTSSNSTIAIGTYDGTTFTQFAASDSTPMVIGTTAFAGKITANYSDNTAAASAFDGQIVTFRITVTLPDTSTGIAYFTAPATGVTVPATTTKFPTNGFGAGDSVNVDTRNLTILGAGSTAGSVAYNGTNLIIGVTAVPEPSAALLGMLGALGLLRRRR